MTWILGSFNLIMLLLLLSMNSPLPRCVQLAWLRRVFIVNCFAFFYILLFSLFSCRQICLCFFKSSHSNVHNRAIAELVCVSTNYSSEIMQIFMLKSIIRNKFKIWIVIWIMIASLNQILFRDFCIYHCLFPGLMGHF